MNATIVFFNELPNKGCVKTSSQMDLLLSESNKAKYRVAMPQSQPTNQKGRYR